MNKFKFSEMFYSIPNNILFAFLSMTLSFSCLAESHLIVGDKNTYFLCAKVLNKAIISSSPSCLSRKNISKLNSNELKYFPDGSTVFGVNEEGENVKFDISVDESEYADSPLVRKNEDNKIALAANEKVEFNVVKTYLTEVNSTLLSKVKTQSLSLWHKELTRAPNRAIEKSLVFDKIEFSALETLPNIIVVKAYTSFLDADGNRDSRGQFFLVVNKITGKAMFSRFGHPEWMTDIDDRVLTILPKIYFTVNGGGETFLMARLLYAWEDRGYAIINLNKASIVALSL